MTDRELLELAADAAEERYLRETLAMLQESYAKAAKPYMDRLVALHSRSLPQMLVTVEQAQALGLLPDNAEVTGLGRNRSNDD